MKLAFSMLCENPRHQTALTTFFREYLVHSLDHFEDLEWIVFAAPDQEMSFEHPRLHYVRDFPGNDQRRARLWADHFRVGPMARRLGAAGLLTIGFVPLRSPLPVFMGVNSLQHLSSDNRIGALRQWYRRWTVARGVRKAALVVTNSQFAASRLREAHPECAGKLLISYEGTQAEYGPEPPPGERDALERGLSLKPGFLLWVSNFYHYKQAPLLLEGYAELPAELRAQMPLVMVGGDWDGGRAAAEAVIRNRGLQNDVRLLGWIESKWLAPLYRHALAYVLPSREETFGRTTTEALSCGTPCLLHDIPIMHEIAGDAAIIIDFDNRRLVADTLRRLLEDEPLRERMRAAGLERAKKFSFKEMAVTRVGAVLEWLQQHAPPAGRP